MAKQYKIRGIPRVELYNPSGKLVKSGQAAVQAAIQWGSSKK